MEDKAKEQFLKAVHLGDLVRVEYNGFLKKRKERRGYISELGGFAFTLCDRKDVVTDPPAWVWEAKQETIFYSQVLSYNLLNGQQ